MNSKKVAKELFGNGADMIVVINTLYALLDNNTSKETISKDDIRELVEECEEYTV